MGAAMDPCPACGDPEFEVLKQSENNLTLQCVECHNVWSTTPPRVRTIELKVVVSHEGEAHAERMDVLRSDEIAVGDEFELNDHRMIVTGIEREGGNADKLLAENIKVLHAKVFDTVPLKFSVNDGDTTRSYRIDVDPDRPISIGEVFDLETAKVVVKTMKSDQNRTIHKGVLAARNVVRCFCDDAPHWMEPGRVVKTRPRGAPPARKGQAPKSRVKGRRSLGPRRK